MPPKTSATRRQREDTPHHVMTQPVFLQKILPFAATSRLSPATFKSVSSSWLETQIHYSGEVLCWKAFYEASDLNTSITHQFLRKCYNAFFQSGGKKMYHTVVEPIFEMSILLSSSEKFASFIKKNRATGQQLTNMDLMESTINSVNVNGFMLLLDAARYHLRLGHVMKVLETAFIDTFESWYIHNNMDSLVTSTIHLICIAMIEKVGTDFFEENFEGPCNALGETPLMLLIRRESLDNGILVFLFRQCRDFGDDFLKDQLQRGGYHGRGETVLMQAARTKYDRGSCCFSVNPRHVLYSTLIELGIFEEEFNKLNETDKKLVREEREEADAQFPVRQTFLVNRVVLLLLYAKYDYECDILLNEIKLILSDRSAADEIFSEEVVHDGANIFMLLPLRCNQLLIVQYLFSFAVRIYGNDRLKDMMQKKDDIGNNNLLMYCIRFNHTSPAIAQFMCGQLKELDLFETQLGEILARRDCDYHYMKEICWKLVSLEVISEEKEHEILKQKRTAV